MEKAALHKLGVALAAALTFVPAALPLPPEIINSFPLTGATPPNPRGIHLYSNSVFVISYIAPAEHYLYEFSGQGSFISSVSLAGAGEITEADSLPDPYPGYYFSAVDADAGAVKIFSTTGSLVGTFMAAPANTVAVAVGGYINDYVYLGTHEGIVYRYSSQGSFLSSFATGINVQDLAVSSGYYTWWGSFVQIAPSGTSGPVYSLWAHNGSLEGSFPLPGTQSLGAEAFGTCYYSLRRLNTGLWVYWVYLGQGMAVEPASLGRVKALFR